MTVTTLMTADELLHMPDDGYRYELLRGELKKLSPSGARSSRISGRIAGSLGAFLRENRIGELYTAEGGFRIARNPDTVRSPDAGFVCGERITDAPGFFEGPPDVAFEVISPTDLHSEVEAKSAEWLRAGTRAVIVIDPERKTARIDRPDGSGYVTEAIALDDILPGWSLPLTELFE